MFSICGDCCFKLSKKIYDPERASNIVPFINNTTGQK